MAELRYYSLAQLKNLLADAKENHSRYSVAWEQNRKVYRGEDHEKRQDQPYEGFPTVRVKYAFQILEVIRVNIVEPNPTFDFVPAEPGHVDTARGLSYLVPKQLKRDRFAHKQNTWVEDDFTCGIHIAKVVQGEHGPTAIAVDPATWFPDPNGAAQEELNWALHEFTLTAAQLEDMMEMGHYDKTAVRELLADGPDRDPNTGKEKGFKGWEFWTRDTVQTFTQKAILSNRPNEHTPGQLPFYVGSTIPRGRCLFGVPEVELVSDSQHLLQALDNIGIETLKYAARPVVAYRRSRVGMQEVQANMRPGGMIPMETPQDLAVFYQGGGADLIFKRKAEALADLQNVTGASSYLAGADSQQYGVNQATATGISILEAAASKRMRHRMMNLEDFYSGIVKGFVKLNSRFMPAHTTLNVRQGSTYRPLKLNTRNFDIDMDVIPRWLNEGTNEEAHIQSLQALWNTLLPLELQGYVFPDGSRMNLRPLAEEMLQVRRWDPRRFFEEGDEQPLLPAAPASPDGSPLPVS